MPTYSTKLRLTKQATGENLNNWGEILSDQSIEMADEAIAGEGAIVTTGGDTTLTINNGTTDQARPAIIRVTGALTSNANIIVPATSKTWDVFNDTSEAYTLTIKVSGQTGVGIPQGGSARVAVTASGDVRFSGLSNAASGSAMSLDNLMTPLMVAAGNLPNPDDDSDRIMIYDDSAGITRYITPNQIGPFNKYDFTSPPTANDDASNTSGNGTFAVGSRVVDVNGNKAYTCVDSTATAAIWIEG